MKMLTLSTTITTPQINLRRLFAQDVRTKLSAMRRRDALSGHKYHGVIDCGLAITNQEPATRNPRVEINHGDFHSTARGEPILCSKPDTGRRSYVLVPPCAAHRNPAETKPNAGNSFETISNRSVRQVARDAATIRSNGHDAYVGELG